MDRLKQDKEEKMTVFARKCVPHIQDTSTNAIDIGTVTAQRRSSFGVAGRRTAAGLVDALSGRRRSQSSRSAP